MPLPHAAAPQWQPGVMQGAPCSLRPYSLGPVPRRWSRVAWLPWQPPQARWSGVDVPRRARHAAGAAPCHSSATRPLLETCLLLRAPCRGRLLTLQSGRKSFAPRARWVPVYPGVFATCLSAACTAHQAFTPGHPCGSTRPPPALPVQAALSRSTPCDQPRRRAPAARWERGKRHQRDGRWRRRAAGTGEKGFWISYTSSLMPRLVCTLCGMRSAE